VRSRRQRFEVERAAGKFTAGDPHLAAMEAMAAKADGLSKTDRMQLDFALGKAYGDLQDYGRSFSHLLAGNASKRSTISFDEASTFALFDRIEAIFTAELIAQKSGGGDPSCTPIFVLGMPRSGTTLIEQIIASHPMVHGAGELQTLNDVILNVRGPRRRHDSLSEFRAGTRRVGVAADRRALCRGGARSRAVRRARHR
jgi:hypothetical protein